MPGSEKYLFGDAPLAGRRLKVLAEVFAESTRPFLLESAEARPGVVVDIGCGPGYSTHLLARVLTQARVVGLDNSESYVSLARETQTDRVSFELHDVTRVPFPATPADMLYCRLLLTHMGEPRSLIDRWATQLSPGGRLLVEEPESVRTEHRLFERYLEVLEALMRHQGKTLYLGPVLDRIGDTECLTRVASRVHRLAVPDRRVAQMFSMNIQTWKSHAFIEDSYPRARIDRMQRELEDAVGDTGGGTTEWSIRQIVYRRN